MIGESKKIILASGSPRRRELLEQLGVQFTIAESFGVDESYRADMPVCEVAASLSLRKSMAYDRVLADNEVLLTADTVVIIDDTIVGKPCDADQAVEMLGRLSGRTHRVITAITLRTNVEVRTISVPTDVEFCQLSEADIAYYVEHFAPFDKAGAYGIQEWIGVYGVKQICGSYHNVMGLPTAQLVEQLRSI